MLQERLFFSIIFLCLSFNLLAQERIIEGHLTNSENKPVEFASLTVSLNQKNSTILTYCFTDSLGHFSFKINKETEELNIEINSFGYKNKNYVVKADTVKSLKIYLETDNKILEEVIIKTEKLLDTMKIKTDSIGLTEQSTLRDVLNKTDGMMVTQDGSISFNGIPINKVLINNKEVFINQNKIALDNLNYEIMDNVQLINNYKDKYSLDFNNKSNTVINIKTKAKFKGVLKYTPEIGLGYNDAYKIKAKSFFFSDKLNMFLTSNTNNISEKDFSFKDLSYPFIQYSSDFLKETFFPFFYMGNLLKKDFNSNNSLTLRKQNKNSKVGLVFTNATIKTEKNTNTAIYVQGSKIQNFDYKEFQNGQLYNIDLNYSKLISKKNVLNANVVMSTIRQKNNSSTAAINFFPINSLFNELNNNNVKAYLIANNVTLTNMLRKKIILNTDVNYFMEQSTNNSKTSLDAVNSIDIYQTQKKNKNILKLSSLLKYKQSNFFVGKAGLSYIFNTETAKNTVVDKVKWTSRTQYTYSGILNFNGETKKVKYDFLLSPQFWDIKNNKATNKLHYNAMLDFTYKINPKSTLILNYERNEKLFDLNYSFDTIIKSYNYKILNNIENKNIVTINNGLDIGYYYLNVAKSKSCFVKYSLEVDGNFIQNNYDTTISNVYYYENKILSNRKGNTINIGSSKGFYLTKKYHKLSFKANIAYIKETYPVVTNNIVQDFFKKQILGSFDIVLLLQGHNIKEIKIGANMAEENLFANSKSIFSLSSITNNILIAGGKRKIEWQLNFENILYKTITSKFNVPNINLSILYKKTDKLSFGILGKSLFDLFKINTKNNSSVNTYNDGSLLTQIINSSRIGYLMFNTTYKF